MAIAAIDLQLNLTTVLLALIAALPTLIAVVLSHHVQKRTIGEVHSLVNERMTATLNHVSRLEDLVVKSGGNPVDAKAAIDPAVLAVVALNEPAPAAPTSGQPNPAPMPPIVPPHSS